MQHLTEKQKLVFHGLIKWPELNDAGLSDKIGINRRTITAIRKGLKENEFYDRIYIPNFEILDLELLIITYGSFKQFSKGSIKSEFLAKNVDKYPELIYSSISHTDFLNMYLSERFTDFKKAQDEITKLFNKYSNFENVTSVHFPLELSKIIFFFDFAPALRNIFNLAVVEVDENIGLEHEKPPFQPKTIKPKKLTDNEKLVLYALTQFPGETDSKISEVTKISRPTVNSIKERLHQDNILKELKIPNLKKLGYDLLVLSHCKLDMTFMKEVYISERVMQKHALPTQPFFLIANTLEPESLLFLIFENFISYKECQDQIANFAKEHKLSTGTVNELIYPIEKLNILKDLNFAPIVKKALDIEADF